MEGLAMSCRLWFLKYVVLLDSSEKEHVINGL